MRSNQSQQNRENYMPRPQDIAKKVSQAQATICYGVLRSTKRMALSASYELGAMAAQLTIVHGVKSTMQADVAKVNRRPA